MSRILGLGFGWGKRYLFGLSSCLFTLDVIPASANGLASAANPLAGSGQTVTRILDIEVLASEIPLAFRTDLSKNAPP